MSQYRHSIRNSGRLSSSMSFRLWLWVAVGTVNMLSTVPAFCNSLRLRSFHPHRHHPMAVPCKLTEDSMGPSWLLSQTPLVREKEDSQPCLSCSFLPFPAGRAAGLVQTLSWRGRWAVFRYCSVCLPPLRFWDPHRQVLASVAHP